MTRATARPSLADAPTLPPAVDLVTAAAWLGIGRTTAYRLATDDAFPVPVIKIGTSLRVPTTALLHLLGIDPAPASCECRDENHEPAPCPEPAPDSHSPAAEPWPGPGEEPRRRPLRRVTRWSVDRGRTS
jgi:hypothetical protein